MRKAFLQVVGTLAGIVLLSHAAWGWHDETHLAIARAAGFEKWFNAAAADMVKIKAPDIEYANHFVNNPPGTTVTAAIVLDQAALYDTNDKKGRLYGAIIATVRNYLKEKKRGKYGLYHLAFCAHYVGDLSQPLHNIVYNDFNKKYHLAADGVVNREVLQDYTRIRTYAIHIRSEQELAGEIARIANIAIARGYAMERENRALTKREAYDGLRHSASLLRAILSYVQSRE